MKKTGLFQLGILVVFLTHGCLVEPEVSKAMFAYRVARYVLSQPDSSPRDKIGLFSLQKEQNTLFLASEDPLFRKIASGGHPDLLTLRTVSKKERSIEVINIRGGGKICGKLPPTYARRGGWRVLIIDSADDLNLNAANALLKILEEPSLRTIILLVSHLPSRLLPTIRSRCYCLNFKPLSSRYFTTVVQKRLS